jgi:hypothetical protein
MIVHTCKSSSREVEAGDGEFEASLGCIPRPFKKTNKNVFK